MTFARSTSLRSSFEPVRDATPEMTTAELAEPKVDVVPALPPVAAIELPLPPQRPSAALQLASASSRANEERPLPNQKAQAAPPGSSSFFDKLFKPEQPSGPALAYASPDDGLIGSRTSAFDRQTAVYDIARHTVTLPDGRRLEAHSGLGSRLDDPRSITEHMRGVTPPNVYELTPREQLFHGVRALRLTPVSGSTFGRVGLLAHTYMLGPRGDSNGCVVFKDYKSFLQAYDSGAIRRLAVVARAD